MSQASLLNFQATTQILQQAAAASLRSQGLDGPEPGGRPHAREGILPGKDRGLPITLSQFEGSSGYGGLLSFG